jgi:hypothetical protein
MKRITKTARTLFGRGDLTGRDWPKEAPDRVVRAAVMVMRWWVGAFDGVKVWNMSHYMEGLEEGGKERGVVAMS